MSPSAYIDCHAPALLESLRQMVGIATINPPGDHYEAMTSLLVQKLQDAGLKTRRYPVPSALLRRILPAEQHGYPRFNVLGKRAVSRTAQTIHFNAHYDVVPVSGQWRHRDAFSGAVSQGWIYGRGTADMKGSAASLIMALQALQATRTPPKLNVEVSFTADEETDSVLGTGWLVKYAPICPDFAVVMEGGEGNSVCCGHNGVVWVQVTVHGRAAHGSRPQDGINALEKMSALVLALEDHKKEVARHTFKTPAGRTLRATLNVGGVFGSGAGAKINTVPATATFTIDRRVLAVENHAEAERDLRAFLEAAARRIPQCRITVEKISQNFACYQPPTHPFFAAVASSVQRVRRTRTIFDTSTGFNDMHFFASELKIPTAGYGPGGEECHGVDERASVRELVASAKIYADLLTTFPG